MHAVVETTHFITAAAKTGLTELDISNLVSVIAADPEIGDLMEGTGGARKLRLAGRGRGKSGGYRIITFYAAKDIPVFLLDCYGKGDKANLTKAERNELRVILKSIVETYRAGAIETSAKRKR